MLWLRVGELRPSYIHAIQRFIRRTNEGVNRQSNPDEGGEMVITVVGFTMKQAKSIGYRSFATVKKASAYVEELLKNGAQVISIRVVTEDERLW